MYPSDIWTPTTKTNKVDLVDAAHMNDVQNHAVAIETELGTDPAGSETDVKSRLYVCIDNDGAIRKGTSFPGSPKEGQLFYRTDLDLAYIYSGSAWDGLGGVPDGSITQVKLATATGEVSQQGTSPSNKTLPGGSYGFYPQLKRCTVGVAWGALAEIAEVYVGSTSYVTNITIWASATGVGQTAYAQQRYITASGRDPWLFVEWDKTTKTIISAWYAPDHPSYGQGGDEFEMPHPFIDYWSENVSKRMAEHKAPSNIELILVHLEQTKELLQLCTKRRTLLTIVNEEGWTVDESQEFTYGQGEERKRDISDETGQHRDLDSIPSYIKIRRLKAI